LAILSFIVYPVLPAQPIGPYGLVQLQETWATVLLVMLATGAMLLRNSLILAILALPAFAYSLVPLIIMFAATAILLRFGGGAAIGTTSEPPPDLKLEQPFSLKAALKFGAIFLGLSVAGALAQRGLGSLRFLRCEHCGRIALQRIGGRSSWNRGRSPSSTVQYRSKRSGVRRH
jgi:uncharacterized membrane protein (DUF4010 family)